MNHFCPEAVKPYCDLNNLEPKTMFLIENAYVQLLCTITCDTDLDVEIEFLLPNTTSLIQLMDQGALHLTLTIFVRTFS